MICRHLFEDDIKNQRVLAFLFNLQPDIISGKTIVIPLWKHLLKLNKFQYEPTPVKNQITKKPANLDWIEDKTYGVGSSFVAFIGCTCFGMLRFTKELDFSGVLFS